MLSSSFQTLSEKQLPRNQLHAASPMPRCDLRTSNLKNRAAAAVAVDFGARIKQPNRTSQTRHIIRSGLCPKQGFRSYSPPPDPALPSDIQGFGARNWDSPGEACSHLIGKVWGLGFRSSFSSSLPDLEPNPVAQEARVLKL